MENQNVSIKERMLKAIMESKIVNSLIEFMVGGKDINSKGNGNMEVTVICKDFEAEALGDGKLKMNGEIKITINGNHENTFSLERK